MKSTITSQTISQLSDLKHYLGEKFVLLIGSAVSGTMKPAVPMVNEVTRAVMEFSAARLKDGNWLDRNMAAYAIDLVNGYHKPLLQSTKFEDFLWRLQCTFGKDEIDELLSRVYGYKDNQYNLNHLAIGFLLQNRYCLACLTTNFDNAIERCLPSLDVCTYLDPLKNLPTENDPPIYYKLHGDAKFRNCIRTSPELAKGETAKSFLFIEELLRDQVVLVLGYSGIGDIDISPHLGRHEKILLWGNHSDEPGILRDNKINFICDLSHSELGKEREGSYNLLLELAASYGWQKPPTPHGEINWESEIKKWVHQMSLKSLRNFIISFISWRTSWPHLQLSFHRLQTDRSLNAKLDFAVATNQVSAYYSAKRILKSIPRQQPEISSLFLETIKMQGFCDWRLKNFEKAHQTFSIILQFTDDDWMQLKDDCKRHVNDIARHALEMLVEQVYRHSSEAKRHLLLKEKRATEFIKILNMVKDECYFLSHIAILEIEYWSGTNVKSADIAAFADLCMIMGEWEAAAVSTQFLLALSVKEGQAILPRLYDGLRNRDLAKLIAKVSAKLRYEKIKRRIPLHVVNCQIFMPIAVAGIELIFAIKRIYWRYDSRNQLIRVETGFLSLGKLKRDLENKVSV